MAPNLAKAGHEVRAFDLSERSARPRGRAGLQRAGSTEEAVADADVVVTMLPAGEARRSTSIAARCSDKAPTSALLIDCSTIDVASARSIEEEAAAQGYTMVDAPVSGGIAAAASGNLDLHGRRFGRGIRSRTADHRADGQGGHPCRRPGRRAGGEDLQQHDPRRDDDRHLRGVRDGAEARARPGRSSSTSRPRLRARAGR